MKRFSPYCAVLSSKSQVGGRVNGRFATLLPASPELSSKKFCVTYSNQLKNAFER